MQQQPQTQPQQQAPSKAQLAREFARNSTLTQKEEELLARLQQVEEEAAAAAATCGGCDNSGDNDEDPQTVLGASAALLPEKPIETVGAFCAWYTDLTERTADPSVPPAVRLPPWSALLESVSGEQCCSSSGGSSGSNDESNDDNDDDLSCFMSDSFEEQEEQEQEQEQEQEGKEKDRSVTPGLDDAAKLETYLGRLRGTRAEVEGWRRAVDAAAAQSAAVLAAVRAVHEEAARLTQQRDRAAALAAALEQRLWHFDQLPMLARRLSARSGLAGTPVAARTLAEMDGGLAFFAQHRAYRDAAPCLAQLARLQAAALATVRDHVVALLRGGTTTVQQQLALRRRVAADGSTGSSTGSSTEVAVAAAVPSAEALDTDPMYLQFRVLAPQVQPHVRELEARAGAGAACRAMLAECHSAYFHERVVLLNPPLTQYLQARAARAGADVAAAVRDCCAFVARVCRLERALHAAFFATPSALLAKLVEAVAASLRDTLRPLLLRERRTDALCLTCSILRQCADDAGPTGSAGAGTGTGTGTDALADVLAGLVREAQERLTFLAQRTIQDDIAAFVPTDADLDYPAKLAPGLASSSCSGSNNSGSGRSEEDSGDGDGDLGTVMERLYAGWYPTLQRTLTLLSKLYMTVDARVFEGLAQEAVDACLDTLNSAAAALTQRRGALDGQLFLVRHLLTLREQLAPFEVAFARETVALDFSRVRAEMRKVLAGGVSALFSLDALAPRVATARADARRRLDAALTAAIEGCIVAWTKALLRPLLSLLVQAASYAAVHADTDTGTGTAPLAAQPWAAPPAFAAAAQHVRAAVRTDVPPLVARALAYLPPAHAAALLRPVRDNVLDTWDRFAAVLRATHPADAGPILAAEPPLPALLADVFQPLEDAVAAATAPATPSSSPSSRVSPPPPSTAAGPSDGTARPSDGPSDEACAGK